MVDVQRSGYYHTLKFPTNTGLPVTNSPSISIVNFSLPHLRLLAAFTFRLQVALTFNISRRLHSLINAITILLTRGFPFSRRLRQEFYRINPF